MSKHEPLLKGISLSCVPSVPGTVPGPWKLGQRGYGINRVRQGVPAAPSLLAEEWGEGTEEELG